MAWDSYHEKAALCLLRCDIDTGRADLPYLKKIYQERIAEEDYESAKSINKLILELEETRDREMKSKLYGAFYK